jgi:hypothetical protein
VTYRDDLDAALARIDALERELAEAKKPPPPGANDVPGAVAMSLTTAGLGSVVVGVLFSWATVAFAGVAALWLGATALVSARLVRRARAQGGQTPTSGDMPGTGSHATPTPQ